MSYPLRLLSYQLNWLDDITAITTCQDKSFYFSPSYVGFYVDGDACHLYFQDIADKVVIYDKFLTNESIFERDDIGPTGVVVCSAEQLSGLGKFKETSNTVPDFKKVNGQEISLLSAALREVFAGE